MPVKRRRAKGKPFKITNAAIDAYRARDYLALHRALNLYPWEMSPIPAQFEPLGCNPANPPLASDLLWSQSFQQAVGLQRELEAACR
ncbi:hypothetical protein LRP31_18805 [Mesorhizobium mediterraneum]|nr:hypothetical protein [Mesorhizobium mediterraneum]WIW51144.1 hypothetical protein LRP31_18805 [Mesorhizobium mediterraneum]